MQFKKLMKSFIFAGRGFSTVFRNEQNFRIQVFVALVTLFLGAFFQIATWQWVVILLLIILILVLEMVNTGFELLVDMLKPRVHHYARDIKNIMAAMVLISAVSAIIIALIIFVPYVF